MVVKVSSHQYIPAHCSAGKNHKIQFSCVISGSAVLFATGWLPNEPVSPLYRSPFCRFSLISKQYLICCSVIPRLVALLTTAWWADWILHLMFFFFLSAVFLSLWSFFFLSFLGSLKFIRVSPSVFPKSGLKLTEDLWVLSWTQRFLCVLQVVVLLIIPVWSFLLFNT